MGERELPAGREAQEEYRQRGRIYEGTAKKVLTAALILWTVFQLWANLTGTLGAVKLRAAHILGLLPMVFFLYPARAGERRARKSFSPADVLLSLGAAVCFGYVLWRYDALAPTGRLNDWDVWMGAACLALAFEGARRANKNLAWVALVFFSYFALWGRFVPGVFGTAAFSFKRVVKALSWDTIGILGTGSGVSATYIFVFVLLGAFLKHSGFSRLIHDLSLTLAGRTAGGPAKVSVIASALMGMINGSAVANVATTGTMTIPLMKKTGYSREFAGAVEAAASTGGQFTPPIMGAVGFVMAEFMGVSYTKVMLAAAIPAALYYWGLMWSVHLEAKRLGLSGLSRENIPGAARVLRERGHLLLPLGALIGMMLLGFTPLYAALIAIFVTVPVSWLRRETGMTLRTVLKALAEGSRGAVGVGACCVIIGVIIGSVNMTGLGVNFGSLVLGAAGQGQLFLGGLLVMVMAVILGMGVPGVAAYVIVYAVAVPVLRHVGATEMAANLFCLMYACLSNITPPVAMSSYVASGISGGNMTKTSLTAVRIGITGFIVPFFFLGNPALLLGSGEGSGWLTLYSFLTALAGVTALASGLGGLPPEKEKGSLRALRIFCRGLLAAAGLLLIHPSLWTDLAALGLAGLQGALEHGVLRKKRPEKPGR